MNQLLNKIVGKTIVKTEYMAMDSSNNTNGNNETVILTFNDGTEIRFWSYGYSLDASIAHN